MFLEVKKLTKSFGGTKVLKGVDFTLEKGQVLSILGSSGSGKTTLLRCINALETADGGEIYVAGNQIFKSSEGIARRIITDVVKYAKKTGSPEILGLVKHLLGIYDFSALGGGIVLSAGKPLIKARGFANADSIKNTSAMLLNLLKNQDVFQGKDYR
jgi:energy-coupling factor transporter ATP-binding protein EcfA2